MKKNIGIAQIISVAIAFLAVLIEAEAPVAADSLYMLSGLGLMVFGIWGAILLIKSDK